MTHIENRIQFKERGSKNDCCCSTLHHVSLSETDTGAIDTENTVSMPIISRNKSVVLMLWISTLHGVKEDERGRAERSSKAAEMVAEKKERPVNTDSEKLDWAKELIYALKKESN